MTFNNISYSGSVNFSLIAGASKTFMLRTAGHIVDGDSLSVESDAESSSWEYRENPTHNDDGSLLLLLSNDRVLDEVPDFQVYEDVTGVAGGLVLDLDELVSSAKKQEGASELGALWTHKPNTDYILTVTNTDIKTAKFRVRIELKEARG